MENHEANLGMGAADALDVPMLRGCDHDPRDCPPLQPVWPQGGGMKYSGIDRCDQCGKPLEDGMWLSGLCKACEKEIRTTVAYSTGDNGAK